MENDIDQRSYWSDIRTMAFDIVRESIDANPEDPDTGTEMWDRVHEAVDGSAWVIYTHRALKVMEYTQNDDAYEDIGEIPSGKGWSQIVSYCAFWSMRSDLSDAVQGELVDRGLN